MSRRFALSVAVLCSHPAWAGDVDRVPEDFPTIQAAVDEGTAGAIQVGPGSWTGARIDREVALVGNKALIDQGPAVPGGQTGFLLLEGAEGARIEGFDLDCARGSLDFGVFASAKVSGAVPGGVAVQGNRFQSCVQGVTNAGSPRPTCDTEQVDGGAQWVVAHNLFEGFATRTLGGLRGGGMGVWIYNAEANLVEHNTFRGDVEAVDDFAIGGVQLAGCLDCDVTGNRFATTGAGQWSAVRNLGGGQVGAVTSQNLLFSDNDARRDAAPLGAHFHSHDRAETHLWRNQGSPKVMHAGCAARLR